MCTILKGNNGVVGIPNNVCLIFNYLRWPLLLFLAHYRGRFSGVALGAEAPHPKCYYEQGRSAVVVFLCM